MLMIYLTYSSYVLLIVFVCVLSCCMSLRFKLCDVASVAISAWKRCLVHLYLQLFVGGPMSYLRYVCFLAYSSVQRILCCACVFLVILCALC